ncbi:MAG: hypothetical protein ACTSR4_01555 [Candidatus Hodarchaeales archaeon]
MSSRDILLTCIWTTDEFIVVDNKTLPAQDEAILKISESESKITVQIPKGLSLITKKIIERRVQSIAKSGFTIPNSSLRIGGGFEVIISKHEEIPTTLLQEGHQYLYEEFSPPKHVTEVVEGAIIPSESEYIPSFLKHDVTESDYPRKFEREEEKTSQEEPGESEEVTSESFPKQKSELSGQGISEILAGKFIIALSEYGDIFFSKNGSDYSVDFSQGKVVFNTERGKIEILRTERLSEDDKTVQLAIETATKEL